MKTNYKRLNPSSGGFSEIKHSSLRSSFRLSKKRVKTQIDITNLDQLPTHIPPKAASLLQINLPASNENINNYRVATIRRPSVWANSIASMKC
jgi:hypothetical protein